MIISAIILSLLSLLVATEPEAVEPSVSPMSKPPVRPLRKKAPDGGKPPRSGQIAA